MIMRQTAKGALAALLATTALGFPSIASAATPAPKFTSPDQNGINLTSGLVWLSVEEGGIGSGEGRVSMQRIWAEGATFVDNWSGGLFKVTSGGVTKFYVQIAGISDTFTGSGSTWTSDKADGATLTVDAEGFWNYTSSDGTKIKFDKDPAEQPASTRSWNCPGADPTTCQVPLSITKPNGLVYRLAWNSAFICSNICEYMTWFKRLSSVTSSAGYSLNVAYLSDSVLLNGEFNPDWLKRTSISFNNSANPPSPQPTISYAYGANTIDVTDPGGRTWRFTQDASGRLTGVRRPGSASDNISYTYGAGGTVTAATKDGVTTSYSLVGSTMTVTDALNKQTIVTSDATIGRPTSYKDPLNRTTSYQYDGNGRLTRTTAPEGNYTQLTYDGRGNVTQVQRVGKNGTSTLSSSAAFDASCSNIVKCNKPNSTTDARGNTTSYTYDPTHGGLLTVTPPSPATGQNPQTRYSYTAVTSATGDPVYMLTAVKACPSGSTSCTVADEVKTSAVYNGNLLPTSITRGNSSGTLAATTAVSYDARGNVDSVDGPLAGTTDTTKYRYDAADQLVGVTSPDPDGAGALKNRAIRITYRPDGQVSKQELGTVTSQSDAAWTGFAALQTVDITFDGNSRPTRRTVSAGATSYAITQTSYDALGRVDCSAVRMNLGGTIPASACTQSTGSPDRISQLVYDAAGQVTELKVGVGTPAAATERKLTYTNNGQVASLTDGNTNVTSYSYDTFDRLYTTTYPGGTYEQNAIYDANGNVTRFRNRAGQVINFTYDALNRLTLKNAPAGELDVTYAYDNLGRLTSASQTGTALSFTYDALSRNLTQVGPQGTVTSEWDLAGRRTKITYPGTGLYVNTDYLVTGEVSKIRENGASTGVGVLASYGYNDVGARTSITYGNGTSRSYTYDPVSRLTSMSLAGLTDASKNLVIDNITYNPASQITGQRRSAAYAWSGYSDVTRSHTVNNLNQLTQTSSSGLPNPINFTYDGKGNLTSDGTVGYCYDSENRLTGAGTPTNCNATATLGYDPFGRLEDLAASGSTASFAYDGLNLIAEYNGATLLRRHVFGPGMDEPIVQYEGTGTTDRRWLYADERGSVMAIADRSKATIATNSYDEYGIPGSSNTGRFQYTGQAYLAELGLYYYKARLYSPTLGRFLQTDPIGYEDNPNLYAYVGNDPVNFVDPLGLSAVSDIVVTGVRPIDPILATGALFTAALVVNVADFGSGASGGDGGKTKQQEDDERKRKCNAIQRAMEKAGDAAADWAALSFDAAMGSWIGGLGSKGAAYLTGSSTLRRAGEMLIGPVTGYLLRFSATSAGVSLVAYAMSGQPVDSTIKAGIQAAVDRAFRRFRGPGGEKLKDELTAELQSEFDKNRCASQ